MTDLPPEQKYTVDHLLALVETTGSMCAYKVSHETDIVDFEWSIPGAYMHVEIQPNGLCEWFASVPTREGGRVFVGTEDEPIELPELDISFYLRTVFW